MKLTLKIEKEYEVSELHVIAKVRYWEDADVNGTEDTEGDLIPCREGDDWKPIIDVETGIIKNWEQGKTADIHYKVCDEGVYILKDEKGETIKSVEGYVIDDLAIGRSGYGDYIIMEVDENGKITDWNPTFEDFQNEED